MSYGERYEGLVLLERARVHVEVAGGLARVGDQRDALFSLLVIDVGHDDQGALLA
jgi:hypothetical protein